MKKLQLIVVLMLTLACTGYSQTRFAVNLNFSRFTAYNNVYSASDDHGSLFLMEGVYTQNDIFQPFVYFGKGFEYDYNPVKHTPFGGGATVQYIPLFTKKKSRFQIYSKVYLGDRYVITPISNNGHLSWHYLEYGITSGVLFKLWEHFAVHSEYNFGTHKSAYEGNVRFGMSVLFGKLKKK